MGVGASVSLGGPDQQQVQHSDDSQQWRSAKSNVLDKLGGAQRRAVRRGDSMKAQLEWLQDALVSQQSAIESALAKDPLAGRHEIMAQEARKAIRSGKLPAAATAGVRLSVKDWQQANHTELRTRILQAHAVSQQVWPSVAQGGKPGGQQGEGSGIAAGRAGEGGGAHGEDDKAALKARMRDYYLTMELSKTAQSGGPSSSGTNKAQRIASAYTKHGPKSPAPPAAPATDAQTGGWRLRIQHAKKTAWRAVCPALAFQSALGGARVRRGPTRVDSFSFFITNQLADEATRYTNEAVKLAGLQQEMTRAQEELDQLRQQRPQTAAPFTMSSSHTSPTSAGGPSPRTAVNEPSSPASSPHHAAPSPYSAYLRNKPGQLPANGNALGIRPSTTSLAVRGTKAAAGQGAGGGPNGGKDPGAFAFRPGAPATVRGKGPEMPWVRGSPVGAQAAHEGAFRPGSAARQQLLSQQSKAVRAGRGGVLGRAAGAGALLSLPGEQEAAAAHKLSELAAACERPRKMMTLYAHRANSRWAESQWWDAAPVLHLVRLAQQAGGQAQVFREAALKALKEGQVAVQVFLAEEVVSLSAAHTPFNLWDTDPWGVLRMLLPARTEGVEGLQGVGLGLRMLLGLATAVELAAGPEAVAKLHVVLHCSEAQESQVVCDLVAKNHCGLNPENVLLIPSQSRHGYVWDDAQKRFLSTRDRLRSLQSQKSSSSMRLRTSHSKSSRRMSRAARAARAAAAEREPPSHGPSRKAASDPATESAAAAAVAAVAGGAGAADEGQGGLMPVPPPPIEAGQQTRPRFAHPVYPVRARSMKRSASTKAHSAAAVDVGPALPAGSGYCMMQLGWEGEALVVDPDTGTPHPLPSSALTYLEERGVRWLATRRLRDLSLYELPGGALDVDWLAAMLWLHESQGAQSAVWVDMGGSMQAAAAGLAGVVLGHRQQPGGSGAGGDPQAEDSITGLPAAPTLSRPGSAAPKSRTNSSPGHAPAKGTPHGEEPLPVVDLEPAALVSPKMAALLSSLARSQAAGRPAGLPMSTRRYMWHLPALAEALEVPGALRPVLLVRGNHTHISFDAAQLTGSPALPCAAVCAGPQHTAKNLASGKDAEELLPIIRAQDAHPTFRRMLATSSQPRARTEEVVAPSRVEDALGNAAELKARAWPGKVVVLLVKDSAATSMALQLTLALLRPGRDLLLLVAVAPGGTTGEDFTRSAVAKCVATARGSGVDCAGEVLPRLGQPLLEMVEEYVHDVGAHLVAMGSRGRTSGGVQAMGSVAYSLMKALPCPLLVVKESARLAADIAWERDAVRLMVPVDNGSRGLLRWACSRLLSTKRGDTVLLARPLGEAGSANGAAVTTSTASADQVIMSKRLLDNFHSILASFNLGGPRKLLEGSYTGAGVQWADMEKAHIMGIQAPPGRTLPESVLKLLVATHSALLLYKGDANGPIL